MNVALFANTGLGNEVLKSLLSQEISIKLVVTRKLEGKFPYYSEIDLDMLCHQLNVNVLTDVNVNSLEFISYMKRLDIDLIIVSSFHQIIKEELINLPRKGIINFHPSLLPQYRGPNPINWVILNAEKYTGITIHKLVKKVDAGDIILQREYRILPFQSLGELFEQLAKKSGDMVKDLMDMYKSEGNLLCYKQDEQKHSYYGKPFDYNYADELMDYDTIINRLRAFVPFPGLNFTFQNVKYIINSFIVTERSMKKRNMVEHRKEEQTFVVPYAENDVLLRY